MKNRTIVSDPGIDDIVALALLSKLSPRERNCLIASFGNGPVEATGRNAQEFISFVAPNWTYCQGASLPINGKIEHPWPDYFHGPDAVWGVHPNTIVKNVEILNKYPSHEYLISLSPMTDALKVLQTGKITDATIMGGAFTMKGNETPYAETNMAFDSDAAAQFFQTCGNVHVRLVPLDMTRKVFWSLEVVQKIPETTKQSRWLKKLLLAWFNNYNHDKEKDFNLHDPLAVYLLFFPEKAIWFTSGVDVIVDGKQRGKTVLESKNPSCEIAWELPDAEAISRDIFNVLFS